MSNKVPIKAIETVYNGYRFRSRLEARWAMFFDVLEIVWEYEKEGYDLASAGRYLPDFWLPLPNNQYPNAGHWFEVKGQMPTEGEVAKLGALVKATYHTGWLVVGPPGEHQRYVYHHSLVGMCGWEDAPLHASDSLGHWDAECIAYKFSPIYPFGNCLDEAITAARQARFEYGENGKRS